MSNHKLPKIILFQTVSSSFNTLLIQFKTTNKELTETNEELIVSKATCDKALEDWKLLESSVSDLQSQLTVKDKLISEMKPICDQVRCNYTYLNRTLTPIYSWCFLFILSGLLR